MKKKIISILAASAILASAMSSVSVSALEYVGFCGERVEHEVDRSYYDDYVKYYLVEDDYDSLPAERKEACEKLYEYIFKYNLINYGGYRNIHDPAFGTAPQSMVTLDDLDNIYLSPNGSNTLIIRNDGEIVYSNDSDYYEDVFFMNEEGSELLVVDCYESKANHITEFGEEEYGYYFYEYWSEHPEATIRNSADPGRYYLIEQMPVEIDDKWTEEYQSGQWSYKLHPNGYAIVSDSFSPKSKDTEPIGEVVIPEEIDGYPVKSVSLSYIGAEKLIIPSGVERIHIYSLPFLEEVITEPSEKLNIAIYNCNNLESLSVDAVDAYTLVRGCPQLTDYELKNTVNLWGGIDSCRSLSSIVLPDTVKTIPYNFAYINEGLKEITIPESCSTIGTTSFILTENTFTGETINLLERNWQRIVPKDCIIKGYYNTEAHRYAIENNIKFKALDDLAYGDTNNDGTIGVADAVTLNRYLLGKGTVGYEGDLNKDGMIDAFDMPDMRKAIIQQ